MLGSHWCQMSNKSVKRWQMWHFGAKSKFAMTMILRQMANLFANVQCDRIFVGRLPDFDIKFDLAYHNRVNLA